MKRSVFILLLFVVVLKCSSIREHGMGANHWGHPYLGTQSSIAYFSCRVSLASIAFYIPMPFLVLDIPLSFVLDTILLPGDLLLKSESQRPNTEDAYCDLP